MRKHLPDAGRMWAYLFLALGLGLSFAGNWAAAYVLEDRPDNMDLAFAGAPPVVVFGAIEVFTRNVWPATKAWQAIRWLFITFVAAPAALVSFIHLVNLFVHGRESNRMVWVIAVASALMIDGLLAGCTAALLIKRTPEPVKPVAAITAFGEPTDLRPHIARLERHIADALSQPPRIFIAEPPKTRLTVVKTETKQKPERPNTNTEPRKRFRAQDHPLWPAWLADFETGADWNAERMIKEQKALGNEMTDAAARALLNRWRKTRSGI